MYVNPLEHVYVADPEHREEGGTPAIVESIRAGLVFQLKEQVGAEVIRDREERLHPPGDRRRWAAEPGIDLLGNPDAAAAVDRVVHRPPARTATSTTTSSSRSSTTCFGIQSRGGCSCAGPYGHRLLGIDIETSHAFEREIARGCEGIKPGWVRVNFNYFISEAVFDFIVRGRGAGRPRGLAAGAAGTGSSRRPGCGATRRAHRSRRCRCTTSGSSVTGWPIRPIGIASPSRASARISPRPSGSSPTRSRRSVRPRLRSRSRSTTTSRTCAGSGCPRRSRRGSRARRVGPPRSSVPAAALALQVERRRVGDGHDGHRPGLDRVARRRGPRGR